MILDTDVWTMAVAIRAIGQVVPNYQLAAASNFARRAKLNGYWNKLYRVDLFLGKTLAANLISLKYPVGSPSALTQVNPTFSEAQVSPRLGLRGVNPAGASLTTGLTPSTLGWSINSMMLAAHVTDMNLTIGGGQVVGALSSGGAAPYCILGFTSTLVQFAAFSGNVQQVSLAAKATGFYIGNRRTSGITNMWKDGVSILGDTADVATGTVAQELYCMGRNDGTGGISSSSERIGSIMLGTGFLDADCVNLSTDHAILMNELRRAL